MIARLRANPRPFVLIAIGLAILGGFLAVVAPLFNTGGPPAAQLAGSLPQQVVAGRQFEVDLAFDNQGDSVLPRTCVRLDAQGPLRPDYAVFQGLDRETFSGGVVCGGSLSGQETISIRLFMTATGAGAAHLALTPVLESTVLGSGLSGAVRAVSP